MIATIIAALTSRAAGPLGAVLALVLALALAGQCASTHAETRRANRAENALELARTELSSCRFETRSLEASVAGQNAAVDAWRTEGEARAREVEKARQAAKSEAERADRAAAALARLKPVGSDLCARMLAVDEAVKEASR